MITICTHDDDNSVFAIVHCCKSTTHDDDSILMERWKKEYVIDDGLVVLVFRYVSIDAFEAPCFVVEDKPRIYEEHGFDISEIENGITLVKPREEGLPKLFL